MIESQQHSQWDDLKQRLQQATLATADASSHDEQRKRDIYRQRATRFATPATTDEPRHHHVPTLVFRLGDQPFGIPLRQVAQVYPARSLTPVPKAPSWVLGIANFETQIRAVIDLADLLNVSRDRADRGGNVLLVRCSEGTVAAQVDRIDEVQDVVFDQLADPDQHSSPARSGLIRGVTPQHVPILRGEALVMQTASRGDSCS